jgi:hypothetical protein
MEFPVFLEILAHQVSQDQEEKRVKQVYQEQGFLD